MLACPLTTSSTRASDVRLLEPCSATATSLTAVMARALVDKAIIQASLLPEQTLMDLARDFRELGAGAEASDRPLFEAWAGYLEQMAREKR